MRQENYTARCLQLFSSCLTFIICSCILFSFLFIACPRILCLSTSMAFASEQIAEQSFESSLDQNQSAQQNPQNPKRRITIGYEGNFGIFQAQSVPGREGYGYEYFQELLKYTKNRYEIEFVEVAWIEGMRMLLDGELDLLPLANYTEERAEIYAYSKVPFVYESPVLLALKDNAAIGGDYKGLNGAKITIHQGNANYDELSNFLRSHNIDAKIIETPYKPITEIREDGYFDYTVSSSLQLEEKLNYAFSLKSHPLYILANKNNQALLDDIDYAIEQLNANDFLFEKKLFVKYFYHDIPQRAFISEEEFKVMQGQEYNVGVVNLNAPVSFYNEKTDELDGLFIEIIKKISDLAGIQVHIHELAQDSRQSNIEAMDFSLIANATGKAWGLPLSIPFSEMPYILIEKRVSADSTNKSPSKTKTLATSAFLDINNDFAASLFNTDDVEIFAYDNPQDVVKAFNKGTVNAILCTRALYDSFDHKIIYQASEIGSHYTPVITFSSHFPQDKIDIFNKLITHLDNREVEDALIRTISRMNDRHISYYVIEYWYIIAFGIFALLFIFFVFYNKMQKQKAYEIKLAEDITPLTGLYTYKKFLVEARTFIDKHPDADLRIITMDIVHFRYINEIFGAEVASQVIQQVAYHIKDIHPSIVPIANYGMDQFSLVAFNQSVNSQDFIKNSRLDDLQKSLEPLLHESSFLNFSLGVYEIVDKTLDVAYMLDCAQIACYKSKETYGTRVEFFTEQMKQESIMQSQMLSLIRTAIKEKEFELFYQPKFDIVHMNVVGAEALIRWFKDGKMISPDQFIPIAEKHNYISELDYHVIELVCQFISSHREERLPHISVNVSGVTIIKSELVDKLKEITQKYNVKAQEIDIEITESALVNNFDMAIKQILDLRELGFTISMDDFGTGVSSLNRLSQMPLDTIKLDRVFIIDALENSKSSVIVKTVIDLAKNIGAKTVAEGIETKEQLELLRNLSCEQGQGYFYARPMSAVTFLQYLDKDDDEN